MVFTAITYTAGTLYSTFDAARRLRSIVVQQQATAAAGAETSLSFPNGAALSNQLRGILGERLVRIKKVRLTASTLAAPTKFAAYLYKVSYGYIDAAETVTIALGDITSLEFVDMPLDLNWAAYTGGVNGCAFVMTFGALTLNDSFGLYLELEVVE